MYVEGYVADPFAYALDTLILFRVGKQRVATDLLGIHAEAGEWCWIDKIQQLPADVLHTAGNPRLRPVVLPLLGMIDAVLGAPFVPLLMLLSLLSDAEGAVKRALGTKEEKERWRAKEEEEEDKRRDAIIAQQGLDKVFDGNWQGDAGQFLLRWYSHSTHHQRLLLATREGIVLAAPPRRVSVGREKHLQIVAAFLPPKRPSWTPSPVSSRQGCC
ncbi:hypothetical protein [Streptomyces sp.]|uniref:hypothetical protein n=1 Tax=Streptomyces sp. TaxID=1931 RepID=UPI00281144F3|nr:hypothetical protein [Streptomyces sp.]